jgi:cytochrome c oxidase subunit II
VSVDRARRRALGVGAAWVAIAATGFGVRAAAPRVIAVSARKFVFTPNAIELTRGEPVTFELTTQDVFMGFSVPDLHVRADIVPGKVTRVSVTPERAGTFPFLCDVFCGDGHEAMSGKLIVTG